MANLPSYDQWMKDTHSLTSPRSEYLKKLDEAIKTGNKETIKTSLDRWRFEQSKQGKDWRKSVRNEKGAVTRLYRAVNDLDKRNLSDEELEALRYIARAQTMALQKQFLGRELKFKSNTLMGLASNTGSKWQRFKTGASSVASGGKSAQSSYKGVSNAVKGAELLQQGGKAAVSGAAKGAMSENFATIRQKVTEFCRELCPDLDPNQIFSALHLGNVENFATDLAPFVGVISSGGKAIVGWIGVARKAWEGLKLEDSRYAFAPGDPEAAFNAVITLLDREIMSESAKAGVKTAAFTGKALGVFADAGAITGPAIGLMELLAEIFQTIIEYVRDYKECKAGNEMLRVGALNFDLFCVCPILGCYFLVIQDHSTIINFAVGDYGTPNWMFDAEKLVGKIGPTLQKARHYITVSRFEIPGMAHAKGVVEQNYSAKTGLDKVTGLPGAIKDKISDRIDAWFEKPEKPPKVDKSRIVGFGSS
jgi:hypothetical protein